MDSSKKFQNSVSFQPIFNFKNVIENYKYLIFDDSMNFKLSVDQLSVFLSNLVKNVKNRAPNLDTHKK